MGKGRKVPSLNENRTVASERVDFETAKQLAQSESDGIGIYYDGSKRLIAAARIWEQLGYGTNEGDWFAFTVPPEVAYMLAKAATDPIPSLDT